MKITKAEKTRAAKLRRIESKGGVLSAEDEAWLRAFELEAGEHASEDEAKQAAAMKAAKRVITAFRKVERAEANLAKVRKEQNALTAEYKSAFGGVVESSVDDPRFGGNWQRLAEAIQAAWQDWQEAESGRKAETHDAIEAVREANAALKKAAGDIQQMHLFD